MDASKAHHRRKPPKGPQKISRWPAYLLGSCLSSIPSQPFDIETPAQPMPYPSVEPRVMAAAENDLNQRDTAALIEEFFSGFSLVSEARAETSCVPGRYLSTLTNSCFSCDPNFYCIGGTAPQAACPPGQVSSPGSDSADDCHSQCTPGQEWTNGGCWPCSPNSYSPDGNACVPCPGNKITDNAGATSVDACHCPPGSNPSLDGSQCNQCLPNWFSPDGMACQPCPNGQVSPAGSTSCTVDTNPPPPPPGACLPGQGTTNNTNTGGSGPGGGWPPGTGPSERMQCHMNCQPNPAAGFCEMMAFNNCLSICDTGEGIWPYPPPGCTASGGTLPDNPGGPIGGGDGDYGDDDYNPYVVEPGYDDEPYEPYDPTYCFQTPTGPRCCHIEAGVEKCSGGTPQSQREQSPAEPTLASRTSDIFAELSLGDLFISSAYAQSADACAQCIPGHYSPGGMNAACQPCAPGQYAGGIGNTTCTPCPAGSYANMPGSASCMGCPSNGYNSGTGNTLCFACEPGQRPNNARDGCIADVPCPAGQAGPGGTACTPCTGNTIPSPDGRTCQMCPAGSEANPEHTACYACSPGEATGPSGMCEPCTGNMVPGPGSTSCIPCGSGTRPDPANTSCESCPAGTAGENGTCTPCTDHRVPSWDRRICEPCPAGNEANDTNTACVPCAANEVSNNSACTPCTGLTVPDAEHRLCVACPAGHTPNDDNSACERCPAGQVSNMGSACMVCPANQEPNPDQSFCVACDPNEVSDAGSACRACACPQGWRLYTNSMAALPSLPDGRPYCVKDPDPTCPGGQPPVGNMCTRDPDCPVGHPPFDRMYDNCVEFASCPNGQYPAGNFCSQPVTCPAPGMYDSIVGGCSEPAVCPNGTMPAAGECSQWPTCPPGTWFDSIPMTCSDGSPGTCPTATPDSEQQWTRRGSFCVLTPPNCPSYPNYTYDFSRNTCVNPGSCPPNPTDQPGIWTRSPSGNTCTLTPPNCPSYPTYSFNENRYVCTNPGTCPPDWVRSGNSCTYTMTCDTAQGEIPITTGMFNCRRPADCGDSSYPPDPNNPYPPDPNNPYPNDPDPDPDPDPNPNPYPPDPNNPYPPEPEPSPYPLDPNEPYPWEPEPSPYPIYPNEPYPWEPEPSPYPFYPNEPYPWEPEPAPYDDGYWYGDGGITFYPDSDYGTDYDPYDYCEYGEEEDDTFVIVTRVSDPPLVPAAPEDVRYRDMCVATSNLGQGAFNNTTGTLNVGFGAPLDEVIGGFDAYTPFPGTGNEYDYAPSGYDVGIPETISPFHEQFVGRVSGAKPPGNACMPMKDTPIVATTDFNSNNAFAYYLNLNASKSSIIYHNNRYRDMTDFLTAGTEQGCPVIKLSQALEDTEFQRSNMDKFALMQLLRADYCYDYYILSRSMKPWYVLEKPGISTDDPLTMFDSDRAYLSSCQPLINGNDAAYVQYKASTDDFANEKAFGFAPVMRYANAPHWDEAEYILGNHLQASWNRYKSVWQGVDDVPPGQPVPQHFKNISLPCIENGPDVVDPFPTGGHMPGQCTPTKKQCPPDLHPVNPMIYQSPPTVGPYYCPNVEKIVNPDHPFTPRTHDSSLFPTDRSYSSITSQKRCAEYDTSDEACPCKPGTERWGYLGSKDQPGYVNWQIDGQDEQVNHVTCAVVPVDILSFRSAAFNACIMDRINHNYFEWLKAGGPDMEMDTTDPADNSVINKSAWYKCKTRYWETDNALECPVKMSIQQCCRIIVKDVVPENFLKLRTCEGLRERIRNDQEIQNLLGGTVPSYSTPATDYDYGGSVTSGNPIAPQDPIFTNNRNDHIRAFLINKRMHELGCNNTEPGEYRFMSYFGDHMPYMRWWDTGVSAGNAFHGGSFTNTLGAFDTLIGVGREERDLTDAERAGDLARDNNQPNREGRLRSPQMSQMGRFGGWTELKAHQMQTTRRYNMACMGRYEKLFKQGSAENYVLAKAGAGYTSRDGRQWPWSLGWRGYVTATSPFYQFPYAFGIQNGMSIGRGLDHALPGDIVMYTVSGVNHIAYVADIGWSITKNRASAVFDYNIGKFREGGAGGPVMIPDRVYLITWDQGKFPTSTGTSVSWGMGIERTVYKEAVPDYYQSDICSKEMSALVDMVDEDSSTTPDTICRDSFGADGTGGDKFDSGDCMRHNCQPSCEDTDLSACVLPPIGNTLGWNNVMLYRPSRDVRACQGDIGNGNFNLNATYNWSAGASGPSVQPNVVYQGQTQEINSSLWAYCANAGMDPPPHYARDYKGPQTGALTDNTLCGAKWGQCAAQATHTRLFPRGWRVYKDDN